MSFEIIRNDITKVKADVIVNSANPLPTFGAGTDAAIYHAAGEEALLAERKKIGVIEPGEAKETPAFGLDARYIIHTVGPDWIDGGHGEADTLRSCYRNTLALAKKLHAKSIAFPLISTGNYGYPKDLALQIALESFNTCLFTWPELKITLVVYDQSAFVLSQNVFGNLDAFIDENYVSEADAKFESSANFLSSAGQGRRAGRRTNQPESERRAKNARAGRIIENGVRPESASGQVLSSEEIQSPHLEPPQAPVIDRMEESVAFTELLRPDLLPVDEVTFQQMLLAKIDEEGWKDSDFYHAAGLTKQVFSKIRSSADYQPSRNTAIACALALHLSPAETDELLRKAGYALSPTSRFDLIIEYCIQQQVYNLFDVNAALYKWGEKQLRQN